MDSSFPTLLLIHKEILITPGSFGHFALHCSSTIPPCLGKACMPTYCFSCELNWHMRGGTSLLLDGGESLNYPQDLLWYRWGKGRELITARWRLKSRYPTQSSLSPQAAAAAAKSLQSCLTLCDPIDSSPPGSAVPGILQARTLEWVAISFSNAWKWKVKVPRQHIKKQRYYFADKGPCSQSYDFSSSYVWMWELDHKEDSAEELMVLNCGAGEDSWESLGLQGDQTSQS